MSNFTQTVMILGVIDFGIGAVGSLLVALWSYVTTPDDFDKDTFIGLLKIFMGGAAVFFVFSVLYVYSTKHQ